MPITVVNKLTGKMLKTSKKGRLAILNALDDIVDEIRDVTEKDFLIPDRYKAHNLRYKIKHQPPDPVKLTSRSGALKKMIYTGKGKWKKGTSTHISDSPAIQGKNRTINKNTKEESYESTISYNIKSAAAISSKRTSSQLIFRLKWDTPTGIKGRRRPLFSGAAKTVGLGGVELIAKKRLKEIGIL